MNLWQRIRRKLESNPVETVDAHTGYERWASKYKDEDNPLLSLEKNAIQTLLPNLNQLNILDFGCGVGRGIKMMADHGAACVVGIDFSFNMLTEAKSQLHIESNSRLLQANGLFLPFVKDSFEVVLSSFVMGHIEQLGEALKEIVRVTRSGGTILISDFHPFCTIIGLNRSFLEWHGNRYKEFRIRNYVHLHEDYFRIFKEANLKLEEIREPRIDDSVKHFFDRTPKGRETYKQSVGYPAVLIFKLSKP